MATTTIRAPEHLLSYSWLELEQEQALRVVGELEIIALKLEKKLNEKRVHDVRVVLRRWYSVWDILAVDGWEESAGEDSQFEKSIGRHLKRLVKNLGVVRDLDVSLSLARDLHINQIVVKRLARERKKAKGKVGKKIEKLRLSKLVKRLKNYLAARSNELHSQSQTAFAGTNGDNGHTLGMDITVLPDVSAYPHINEFLLQSEHQCRLLCDHNRGQTELHELRLAIKRWRYLLSEFFGLTNLELVRAQQILGRIRDLERLRLDMERLNRPLQKAVAKGRLDAGDLEADKALLQDGMEEQFQLLEPVLQQLPFGLRPYLLSL